MTLPDLAQARSTCALCQYVYLALLLSEKGDARALQRILLAHIADAHRDRPEVPES